MARRTEDKYFVTCMKGFEKILESELHALNITKTEPDFSGVYFTGDQEDCYRANVWLRTGIRVLRELKRYTVNSNEDLYNGAKSIFWGDEFRLNQTFAVSANVNDSVINHSGYAALKVKDAIADNFRDLYGSRPNVDTSDPDVRVVVRIQREECVLSIDTSGEALHRRGYRVKMTKAPIKENLAAGILLMAGYNGSQVLYDIMCGSGTFSIEAALIALNIAPGLSKESFGFQRLISFDKRLWAKVKREAESTKRNAVPKMIYASDISKKSVEVTKSNARKAGIRNLIDVSIKDFRNTHKRTDTGIIVVNPPYGIKLETGEDEKLIKLYSDLGDTLKQRFTGHDAYIISTKDDYIKKLGLKAASRMDVYNGPIECNLSKYELYEGTEE
ncbi:class I SAM-dependent RNA methyltransferase [Thermodesulfobacteriota bacterium]